MDYPTAIAQYFDGDEALFRRFAVQFAAEGPGLVAQIGTDLADGLTAEAAIGIHTLKGQLRYLGHDTLANRLQQLETWADAATDAALAAAWPTAAATLRRTIGEVAKIGAGAALG